VGVHDIFVYGPDEAREEVKIKTSSPKARFFIDALMAQPYFNRSEYRFSSHALRAIVSSDTMLEITKPMVVPLVDVFEELWQNSHITPTFIAKIIGGSLLLAYAMLKNDLILMVGSLLFTPFTPLLLGISFGLRSGDR